MAELPPACGLQAGGRIPPRIHKAIEPHLTTSHSRLCRLERDALTSCIPGFQGRDSTELWGAGPSRRERCSARRPECGHGKGPDRGQKGLPEKPPGLHCPCARSSRRKLKQHLQLPWSDAGARSLQRLVRDHAPMTLRGPGPREGESPVLVGEREWVMAPALGWGTTSLPHTHASMETLEPKSELTSREAPGKVSPRSHSSL